MSNDAGIIAGAVLFVILFLYILWPEKQVAAQRQKTRLDFLAEQRDQIYTNLRDLNFEFQQGKYPLEDYTVQRAILENEATAVLAEMDELEALDQAIAAARA